LIFKGFFISTTNKVSHNFGNAILKLPSHLAESRHGFFYFRLTFKLGGFTKEKRMSLRTKN